MENAPKDAPFAAIHMAELRCDIKALEIELSALGIEKHEAEAVQFTRRAISPRPSATTTDAYAHDRVSELWHGTLLQWSRARLADVTGLLGGEGTVLAGVQAALNEIVGVERLDVCLPWAKGSTLKILAAGTVDGGIDTLIASIGRQKVRDFDTRLQLEVRDQTGSKVTIILDPDEGTQSVVNPHLVGPVSQFELVISTVEKKAN